MFFYVGYTFWPEFPAAVNTFYRVLLILAIVMSYTHLLQSFRLVRNRSLLRIPDLPAGRQGRQARFACGNDNIVDIVYA
jgi:hypothetical protein